MKVLTERTVGFNRNGFLQHNGIGYGDQFTFNGTYIQEKNRNVFHRTFDRVFFIEYFNFASYADGVVEKENQTGGDVG
jgi:hypothetical protein